MTAIYSRQALRDVASILDYVHERNPSGALNVSLAIEYAVGLCARHPRAGSLTDEPQVLRRPLTKYRYTIFYKLTTGGSAIEIVRIVHASRIKNLRKLPDDE